MKKSNINLNKILFLVIAGLFMTIISCRKDNDNNNNNVVDYGNYNSVVIDATDIIEDYYYENDVKIAVAELYWYSEGRKTFEIARSAYNDNSFKLTLGKIDKKHLYPIAVDLEDYDINKILVSDKTVKWYWLEDITAYNNDAKEYRIASFRFYDYNYDYENNKSNYYYIKFIYVDRDVTIKGTDSYQQRYESENYIYIYNNIIDINLTLKKGWNVIYDNYTNSSDYNYDESTDTQTYTSMRKNTISNQKSDEANYKWYLGDGGYYYKSTTENPNNNCISIFAKSRNKN